MKNNHKALNKRMLSGEDQNKHMKLAVPSPKRRPDRADRLCAAEDKFAAAEKQIKKLERELANRNDEIDLLKKAERFFQWKK